MSKEISSQSLYEVKVSELKHLMQAKGNEAKEILANLGGTQSIVQKLHTDTLNGLDETDLENRVKAFGKNQIPPKPSKSIFILAFEAIQDATLFMLLICAVISIGLYFYHPPSDTIAEDVRHSSTGEMNLEWVEGVAILIAVLIVVFVTAFNDWRKERQFRGLQDQISKDNMISVIRKGQVKQINMNELLVGDISCIKYGDLIPADGIVVRASDLKVDESSLTGETDLMKKSENDNMLVLSGNFIIKVESTY